MTLQAKAFQWSMGIHGMVILIVAMLQFFAVSQTKVTVIDFTFSGNNDSSVLARTLPYQAPAAKAEPQPAKAMRTKSVLEKEAAKEIIEKKIVRRAVEEQDAHRSQVEQTPSPSEVLSAAEPIAPSLLRTIEGPGGSFAEETGNSSTPLQGGYGAGGPTAKGASPDPADRGKATQGATEHLSNDGAGPTPESSRATYLKEHFVYIRDRITRGISYPYMARKMNWCGQVKIAFVVCEDGGVNDVRVVESSGFSLLDGNAVETVKRVAPFPNPPVKAEIRMAITYRLN